MKLLFITTGYLPMPAYKGGAVNTLLQQYVEYNKSDEIIIYSIGGIKDKNYIDNNVTYKYIHSGLGYRINTCIIGILNQLPFFNLTRPYIKKVVKEIIKNKQTFDYVILENTPKSIIYISKNIKGKKVLHLHNDYLNIRTKYGKKIINCCDKIICVSDFIKQRVDNIAISKKTEVVHNGINFDIFINNYNKYKLREKYNIEKDKKIVLYVGRLLEKKGIFDLLDSFTRINCNNAMLLIVGNGSKKIRKKINNYLNSNSNIKMLDYVDNSKISEIYSLADIGVVPSKCNEAFGLTVIEGLACNLKMIVSNDGAIPEIVKDQNCILIDKNNLKNELYKTLKHEINKDEICKNNIELLKENFSIDNYCKNFSGKLS